MRVLKVEHGAKVDHGRATHSAFAPVAHQHLLGLNDWRRLCSGFRAFLKRLHPLTKNVIGHAESSPPANRKSHDDDDSERGLGPF